MLVRKPDTEIFSHLIDRLAEEVAIRTGDKDEFEYIEFLVALCESYAPNTPFLYHNHLPWLDIAQMLSADRRKGARLRRDDVSAVERCDRKRSNAAPVAQCDKLLA